MEKWKGGRKGVRTEDEEWEKSLDEHRSKDKQHWESIETLGIGSPNDGTPLTVVLVWRRQAERKQAWGDDWARAEGGGGAAAIRFAKSEDETARWAPE